MSTPTSHPAQTGAHHLNTLSPHQSDPSPLQPWVQDVTGLILAGGEGSRMGYLNKGLQPFCGSTLIEHVLTRLKVQVGPLVINANKDLDRYASLGLDIWSDANKSVGPLSGFLTGLTRASTPYLMVTPCDTPLLPTDLVERMLMRLEQTHSDLCMPVTRDTPNEESRWFKQPAFCLMKRSLAQSLVDFLASGQTKIQAWATLHRLSLVEFDSPPYDARSFVNVNTLEQLRSLELELQKNNSDAS